ncbi:hypothetical protein F542_17960 [Bibersteinia trehalosi USDA-ARS-USMARC-188]|uniref:Uncharacterized protein n=2 Tax=Bibersteinia trehalosi TaxID=47735 RepID=A0A4V7IC03_BIBTR|nr:hypothetical protein WQG_4000 [Bibersteinia trehalosi USDA-ARS-USMARC-192]AHG82511.1 hypothetical protein F542_17960 [Bibersteinia trehalosi USDA-ARS-USMARC-188]AHG84845.1 hypothetical protein F543_19840 [Bibersteinia trehalosi USDA-ARS-USMARC-189]
MGLQAVGFKKFLQKTSQNIPLVEYQTIALASDGGLNK